MQQNSHDLNKALYLSVFSLIGCVIPLLGLILAIVGIATASRITEDDATRTRRSIAIIMGIVGIILAVVSTFVWISIYQTNSQEALRQQRLTQQQEAQLSDTSAAQDNLDECLSQADMKYQSFVKLNAEDVKDTSEGKAYQMSQALWDQANNTKKLEEDSCYKRYPDIQSKGKPSPSVISIQ